MRLSSLASVAVAAEVAALGGERPAQLARTFTANTTSYGIYVSGRLTKADVMLGAMHAQCSALGSMTWGAAPQVPSMWLANDADAMGYQLWSDTVSDTEMPRCLKQAMCDVARDERLAEQASARWAVEKESLVAGTILGLVFACGVVGGLTIVAFAILRGNRVRLRDGLWLA